MLYDAFLDLGSDAIPCFRGSVSQESMPPKEGVDRGVLEGVRKKMKERMLERDSVRVLCCVASPKDDDSHVSFGFDPFQMFSAAVVLLKTRLDYPSSLFQWQHLQVRHCLLFP